MVFRPTLALFECVSHRARLRHWQALRRMSAALLMSLPALVGCGGSKVLEEASSFVPTGPLVAVSDEHLAASLEWVIFRDGPGTWATNADWDEYLMRIRNTGDAPLQITRITVFDSLGTRTEARTSHRQLVNGTRETKIRYNDNELQVGASWRSGPADQIVVAAMGTGAVVGATAGAGMVLSPLPAAYYSALWAGITVLPVVAVGGVERSLNHSEVDRAIMDRQTLLPVNVQAGEERNLNIFFPLTPSPRRIEIVYSEGSEQRIVTLDTLAALQGLHLSQNTGTDPI